MSSLVPYQDAIDVLQAANLGLPIAYPNLDFQQPNPPSMWLSVSMVGHTLDPIELTGGAWEEAGVLDIFVIVPTGEGSKEARAMAKTIANTYRLLPLERNVVYREASIGMNATDVPDGNWWVLGVSIAYSYQDTSNSV